MKMILLFLTCANDPEAKKIARALLQKRLIVCAKRTPVSSSFYWENKIDSAKEVLLIMESIESNFKKIEKEVKKLHSYETFVLVSLPVTQASTGVAAWMKAGLR
jgi:periplasmic divalent cation tolerance protein